MTHTTEQLQGMSDAKINEAVALKLGMVINNYCGDAVMCGFEGLRSTFADRDYCNSPDDIMPLAFERGVSLIKSQHTQADQFWVATNNIQGYMFESSTSFHSNGGASFMHTNPLRAIACLLLLIGGG